jgi:hypothetical protein
VTSEVDDLAARITRVSLLVYQGLPDRKALPIHLSPCAVCRGQQT